MEKYFVLSPHLDDFASQLAHGDRQGHGLILILGCDGNDWPVQEFNEKLLLGQADQWRSLHAPSTLVVLVDGLASRISATEYLEFLNKTTVLARLGKPAG